MEGEVRPGSPSLWPSDYEQLEPTNSGAGLRAATFEPRLLPGQPPTFIQDEKDLQRP